MNKVIIVTNKEDVTVDFVIEKLKRRGCEYYRFNTEDVGLSVKVIFNKSGFFLEDGNKGASVELDGFDSVYFRRPKLPSGIKNVSPGKNHFYLTEIDTLLEGVYRCLSHKFWLNSVFSIRMAENKPYQLISAEKCGFSIPNFCISNHYEECVDFFMNHDSSVFKPLKTGLIEEPDGGGMVLYTTEVCQDFVDNIYTNKGMPIYFQEQIIKNCDVRVTVVGGKVFPAKIISQDSEVSRVDWRRSKAMLSHEKLDLPGHVKEKCLRLCKNLNLNFAAIDFIIDNEGKYWFLEINPNGQWAWIELLLGYPISEEIADLLIMGEKSVRDHF